MHRLVTQGLMTVVLAALAAGCSEDDTTRRMQIGGGGTAGSGGGSGDGGSAGSGVGGTAGNGNGGSGGGAADLPPACSGGCAEMNVPVTATSTFRQARYLFRLTPLVDMSNAVITWRVKMVTPAGEIPPDQIFLIPFVQNAPPVSPAYDGYFAPMVFTTPPNGFNDADTYANVVLDMAALSQPPAPAPDAGDAGNEQAADAGDAGGGVQPPPAGFDITQVAQYGIDVGTSFTGEGTVRVAVDSITIEGADLESVGFDTDLEGFLLENYQTPPGATLVHRP